jgi:pimeloyl-ACP methyl ester carboxylesterase
MKAGISRGMRSLRSAISRIAILLGAVFAVAIALLWIFQERLVFLPPPVPATQGRGSVRVDYAAADGQALFGFLVEPKPAGVPGDSARGAIIVFHGNGDLADSWIDWARMAAARTGCRVFLAEYRGYGGITGKATFEGTLRDARAAFDVVSRRYVTSPEQIVLFGHSLGSGIAAKLATERSARSLVLEAPITSLVDMGRRSFGPPMSWILPMISRSQLAPVEHVRHMRTPVWVAVGGADDVVPPEMGRAVFAAAAQKGELLEVEGANHGNIADRGGERYWRWLVRAVGSGRLLNSDR